MEPGVIKKKVVRAIRLVLKNTIPTNLLETVCFNGACNGCKTDPACSCRCTARACLHVEEDSAAAFPAGARGGPPTSCRVGHSSRTRWGAGDRGLRHTSALNSTVTTSRAMVHSAVSSAGSARAPTRLINRRANASATPSSRNAAWRVNTSWRHALFA